jgi:hypothetical protein
MEDFLELSNVNTAVLLDEWMEAFFFVYSISYLAGSVEVDEGHLFIDLTVLSEVVNDATWCLALFLGPLEQLQFECFAQVEKEALCQEIVLLVVEEDAEENTALREVSKTGLEGVVGRSMVILVDFFDQQAVDENDVVYIDLVSLKVEVQGSIRDQPPVVRFVVERVSSDQTVCNPVSIHWPLAVGFVEHADLKLGLIGKRNGCLYEDVVGAVRQVYWILDHSARSKVLEHLIGTRLEKEPVVRKWIEVVNGSQLVAEGS